MALTDFTDYSCPARNKLRDKYKARLLEKIAKEFYKTSTYQELVNTCKPNT